MGKSKSENSFKLNIDNNLTEDPKTIVDHFAEFLESVPSQIKNEIPKAKEHFTIFNNYSRAQSMSFHDFHPAEIAALISSLNNSNATDESGLSNNFFKQIAYEIAFPTLPHY